MKEDPALLANPVRAEAAAWIARLHGSGRSRALEAGLRKWLEADPAHARAFEVATEAWEIGGGIPAASATRRADPFMERSPRRRAVALYFWAIAAAALIGTQIYLQHRTPYISTAVGEQRVLILTDGTRIVLNTNTRLSVRETASERRVRVESGEALFDVVKDPHRPFLVTAGDQEVVTLGTSFIVRRDTERLTVTLMEGKVAVSPIASAPAASPDSRAQGGMQARMQTFLTPGQRLTFTRRSAPKLDEPRMQDVTAWRRGEVILDGMRLQDAADEMNRYSAVKVIVDDPAAADIRVSGIFRAGDSVRFAWAVGEAYRLAVTHESQRIFISSARP